MFKPLDSSIESLRNLADGSWSAGVPSLVPGEQESKSHQENLRRLEAITESVKTVFTKYPKDSKEIAGKVAEKCWTYAFSQKEYAVACRAAAICAAHLPKEILNEKDRAYLHPLTLSVEQTQIPLIGYQKRLLRQSSLYFDALFGDNFDSKDKDNIVLNHIDPELFKNLLSIAQEEQVKDKTLDIESLGELLGLAEFFDLWGAAAAPIITALHQKLDKLQPLQDQGIISLCHLHGILSKIGSSSATLGLGSVQKKIKKLLFDKMEAFESLAELGNFTKKFGAVLPYVSVKSYSVDDLKGSIHVTHSVAEVLSHCQFLEGLIFKELTVISAANLVQFALDCPQLQELKIESHTSLVDDDLQPLNAKTGLKSLGFGGCVMISGAAFPHLRSLQGLVNLDLWGCSAINEERLIHLQAFQKLRSLNLSLQFNISDEGLAHLKTLTALQTLNLGGCTKVTNQGIGHLTKLPLKVLNIASCMRITLDTRVVLLSMQSLEKVEVCSFGVSQEARERVVLCLEPVLRKGITIDGGDLESYKEILKEQVDESELNGSDEEDECLRWNAPYSSEGEEGSDQG